MGSSGSGKSSILNAILGEERLLPCSTWEACTAVAVEIVWNPVNDESKAYRAEIQFVTVEEWKAELDLLVAVVIDANPAERISAGDDDREVACAKIKAVYPHLAINKLTAQSAGELVHDIAISKLLGQTKMIEKAAGKGAEFATEIKPYIKSTSEPVKSRRSFTYWPLVKTIRLFTKSSVLSTGLVLVDLPGSGDSNAAREKVAQEYLQRVSAICIVDKIERASTSAVTRDLFERGGQLRLQLLRSGHLDDNRTFFVLTATDSITNTQYIEEQDLSDRPVVAKILEMQRALSDRKNDVQRRVRDCAFRKNQLEVSAKKLAKHIAMVQTKSKQSSSQALKRKRSDNDLQSSGISWTHYIYTSIGYVLIESS
jgi:GTPase SAR1 family protein